MGSRVYSSSCSPCATSSWIVLRRCPATGRVIVHRHGFTPTAGDPDVWTRRVAPRVPPVPPARLLPSGVSAWFPCQSQGHCARGFRLGSSQEAVLVALLLLPMALIFWHHLGWQSLPVSPGQSESPCQHLKWRALWTHLLQPLANPKP